MTSKLLYRPYAYWMKILPIAILFCLFTSHLSAADTQLGGKLHQDNCIACHAAMTGGDGSVLYTRKDRRVTSLDSLAKQVHRCQSSLGLNWSTDQQQNVQHYLNEKFYNF